MATKIEKLGGEFAEYAKVPLSPQWWLLRLEKKRAADAARVLTGDRYYDGHHPLLFATPKFREAFGNMFAAFADNWCQVVVDATAERLKVEGFRIGDELEADDDAWDLWQRSYMDEEAHLLQTEVVKVGRGYLLVGPGEDGPEITAEHPAYATVAHERGSRRRRAAGLKTWVGDDELRYANVYLPEAVYHFRSTKKARDITTSSAAQSWVALTDAAGEFRTINPARVVPLIPFYNARPLDPEAVCQGEVDRAAPLQDAINKMICDGLVASEFISYPQRWATGLEVPVDPTTGQATASAQMQAAVSRLWSVPDPDVKFGSFPQGDLAPYVKFAEMLVQHLAAQTRTPPHYLLGSSGTFPSGESLKSTETGLVAKVLSRQTAFGESYEETLRVAYLMGGRADRARIAKTETIWRDPESRTEGERVDALLKMATLGVPKQELWRRWGASPVEIRRWERMIQDEQLAASLAGLVPPPNKNNAPPDPDGITDPIEASAGDA